MGSATWINEPGPSSNLCVEHRIFEDVWGTFKGFRKWTPIAGWFTMENPSMDDIGVPPISGNHHITIITVSNSLTYIKSGPPPMGTQALCDLPMADAGMMEYINDSIGGPQKDRHVMKCYDMLLPTIWMMAYFSILFGTSTLHPKIALASKPAHSSTTAQPLDCRIVYNSQHWCRWYLWVQLLTAATAREFRFSWPMANV